MKLMSRAAALVLAAATVTAAGADPLPPPPGLQHWVVSLVWSPQYCERRPGTKEPQCTEPHGFVLSSLQPVPPAETCVEDRKVGEVQIESMLGVMANVAAIRSAWKKDGACSGLDQAEYFVQARFAAERVRVPAAYAAPAETLRLVPAELQQAFFAVNPGLDETSLRLECGGSWLKAVRVCLDREFAFARCPLELHSDCEERLTLRRVRKGLSDGSGD